MVVLEVWGGFAINSSNPHGANIPPKPPKPGTFSRNVRFEGQGPEIKNSTIGASTVSEPRYGFELQSTRRPRPPLTNAFKQTPDSPTPKPRKINESLSSLNSLTNSPPVVEKKKQKPVPKPRANSELASNAYVISLKIGSNDGLPEPSKLINGSYSA